MSFLATTQPRNPVGGLGLRTVSGSFLARGASIAASFCFAALVARQLGPEAAGHFFVLFAVFTGAATLGRFGTDNMAIKRIAGLAQGGRREALHLLRLCAVCSCGAAALMAVVTAVLARTSLSGDDLVRASALLGVAVVPASLSVTASAILRARGRMASGTMAELGATPLLGSVLLVVWGVSGDADLFSSILVFSVANVVTSLWAVPAAVRVTMSLPSPRPNDTASSTTPATAVAAAVQPTRVPALASMMLTSLFFYLLTWAPVLTLGLLSSHSEAAYYNSAARLTAVVALLPSIQVTYLAPRFAAFHHHGEMHSLNHLAQRSTRRATVVAVLLGAALMAFPYQALQIYGGEYSAAAGSLRALALSATVVVAIGPVNTLMLIAGLERGASLLNAATLAVTVFALVVAGPRFGSLGASVVMSVMTIAYAVTAGALLHRRSRITAHAFASRRPEPREGLPMEPGRERPRT
jgi:O-antigen/teichoic acid export membrane protein